MSCIDVLQSTATWLPFTALDSDDSDPRTGILYTQVTVVYKKSSQTSFQAKVLTGAADFREVGLGVYEISFSAAELDTLGSFIYVVNSNGALPAPAIIQDVKQANIVAAAAYTPGGISVSTNVLTGNLVDLNGVAMSGEAVSARIMSIPTISGVSPNIGGIGSDTVGAQTDSTGFFALEVVQGAVIDVSIPSVGYRRTLTVPSNATDNLFDIP